MRSLIRKALCASLSFIAICLVIVCSAQAATICVSDTDGLQTALTQSASNGEKDIIRIQQGTYVGNFVYDSFEANAITIEGGYTYECVFWPIDLKTYLRLPALSTFLVHRSFLGNSVVG